MSRMGGTARELANFNILMDGQAIGSFDRKLTLFDRYAMDIYGDPEKKMDRRMALALAVVLHMQKLV